MALAAENIADLVTTTQRELGRLKWTDLASDLQEYIALPKLMKGEKVQFDSGTEIQFNVMTDYSDAAENVGLFATDNVNVQDAMATAHVPWRHTTTNYAFDRREVAMNREPSKIVDLVKARRAMAMIGLTVRFEADFWSKPATSADVVKPYGIKYWAPTNATEGFNGGDPSGFTAGAAGLASATYTNWQNWTAQYTDVTKPDLITKWRKAATYTNFKSPIDINDYNKGNKYGYYTNYDVIGELETLLEDQNDNLGNDLASKDGLTIFRRQPVTWVPHLDSDSTDPIYGINWGVFYPVFLKGEYMVETNSQKAGNQHTVLNSFIDCTYNYKCCDRRRLFVLYK